MGCSASSSYVSGRHACAMDDQLPCRCLLSQLTTEAVPRVALVTELTSILQAIWQMDPAEFEADAQGSASFAAAFSSGVTGKLGTTHASNDTSQLTTSTRDLSIQAGGCACSAERTTATKEQCCQSVDDCRTTGATSGEGTCCKAATASSAPDASSCQSTSTSHSGSECCESRNQGCCQPVKQSEPSEQHSMPSDSPLAEPTGSLIELEARIAEIQLQCSQ